MEKVLRVGIIGQGRSGYGIHAHYLRTAPQKFQIVAVADLLKDRRRQAEEEFGCATCADYRNLFRRGDLDFLVNATPSHLHVPVTRDCLKAGFNVLCEKPLARKAKDVDALLALARKKRRLFAVYQQSRFNPYFEKVRETIDSGVLGRVVMVKMAASGYGRRWDWQTIQSMNGGNLLNTGPHPVDQALVFFDPKGSMPNVWCRMDRANTFGDAEDHVKLLLWGKGRPTIDLEISSCSAYPTYALQVYGTRGGLTHSGGKVQWRWFDPAEAPRQKLIATPMPGRSYCSEKLPWREDQWEKPMEVGQLFDFMAAKFYDNLRAALTEGAPLAVPPIQVRRQIAVMEEAHRQNPLSRRKK